MAKIILNKEKNSAFKWYQCDNISVKGSFFDHKESYYEKEALVTSLKSIRTFNDFQEVLRQCNGLFSVVMSKNDEVWLAVDRNISFPLFYTCHEKEWIISDLPENINYSNTLNQNQLDIFSSFGHTFGNKTLIQNVFQVQCAEAVCLKNGTKTTAFYHDFSITAFNNRNRLELRRAAITIFENTIFRLIKSLNGRTAVVPLSGGYDSRFIVSALKKAGYKKVICITYGKKKNNPDLELSKKVAEQLGYRWIFVEYTNELFGNFIQTKEFENYIGFTGHASSMFYLQEYFAVKHLKENQSIPEDSVFIPGHSGDLIGGSQLIKVFDKNLPFKEIRNHYLSKKSIYSNLSRSSKNWIVNEIDKWLKTRSNYIPATLFEELDIREKISKIIFNSSLVFDFFGYEKRFPFWDVEFLGFFLSLPMELREMKQLYDNVLEKEYFEPLEINFKKEIQPSKEKIVFQDLKNQLKRRLPIKAKQNLLKHSDWINYYEATLPLIREMRENEYTFDFKGRSYNEILIQYYIYTLKKG